VSVIPPPRGSADTIFLQDVRFFGRHGGPKGEPGAGAWFSVDVELALDLTPASLSDDLGATVDYQRVAQRIVELGREARVNLLERLGALLAEALLREFAAQHIRLRLRKLSPPLQGLHGVPGVEITRRR
jgi:dihydroneopterin aldolase